MNKASRKEQFDFGRRLIAKFVFKNDPKKFYGKGFSQIPRNKLYQENDSFQSFLEKM